MSECNQVLIKQLVIVKGMIKPTNAQVGSSVIDAAIENISKSAADLQRKQLELLDEVRQIIRLNTDLDNDDIDFLLSNLKQRIQGDH